MRSITAGAAARSPAGLAIDGVEAAFSTMGRNGPAQANAWQANRRTAARYPRCIPRAPAIRVTIDGKSAFLCHIWLPRHVPLQDPEKRWRASHFHSRDVAEVGHARAVKCFSAHF